MALAEVRGGYAYVVPSGGDGYEATCLTRPRPTPALGWGCGGPLTEPPSARGIVTSSVREDQLDVGGSQCEVTGKVGTDVLAVTIAAPGVDVHATLQNERFAAW